MEKISRKTKINIDRGKQVVFAIFLVIFVVYSVFCLYPYFWVFMNSVKGIDEYYKNMNALPKSWNLNYYLEIFTSFKVGSNGFFTMLWNSVWYTLGGRLISICACICVAYPLAKYNFPCRGLVYGIIIFKNVNTTE